MTVYFDAVEVEMNVEGILVEPGKQIRPGSRIFEDRNIGQVLT